MTSPDALSRQQLESLAFGVRAAMFYDEESDTFDPEKDVNGGDLVETLHDLLATLDLIPETEEDEDEDEEPSCPDEGDLLTYDHRTFYQDGKLVLDCSSNDDPDGWKADLKTYMDLEQFWPNVWFISDHGNAHLMNLED